MKDKWRKNSTRIILAVLLWVCMLWSAESQALADAPTGVYPVYMIDSDEEVQYFGPGVCLSSGGTPIVFTRGYDSSMQALAMAAEIEGQVCVLVYDDGSESLSSWCIHEDSLANLSGHESAFLTPEAVSPNEKATAYYHYESNGEVIAGGTEVTVRGINADGYLEADDYPTGILYPASLVSGQGQLVGILLGDNVCVPLSGGQSAAAPTAPPLPSRETSTSTATVNGNVSPQPKGESWMLGVIGLIGAAILVVLIIILAGRKKPASGNANRTAASGVSGNTGDTMMSSGAFASSAGGKSSASGKVQLWLLAKGGCMNGRVYPIEQSEITIGRDASMVIRFPADTRGVSRIHAKLYWQGSQLMLMDCNSTSGTFLKRQGKLAPMAPVAVQSGDVFYIGEKANCFEINTGR